MTNEKFKCQGRIKDTFLLDFWTTQGFCSYCGSIKSKEFFDKIKNKKPVIISRETKTFYFEDGSKFCYHHCTIDEQELLKDLYLSKKMIILNKK